jgi:hypothetical protein
MKPVKKTLSVAISTKQQLSQLSNILIENLGKPQETWRYRKIDSNGNLNVGKRCRIVKHLDKGKNINLVIQVFENENNISDEDMLFFSLSSCGN